MEKNRDLETRKRQKEELEEMRQIGDISEEAYRTRIKDLMGEPERFEMLLGGNVVNVTAEQ